MNCLLVCNAVQNHHIHSMPHGLWGNYLFIEGFIRPNNNKNNSNKWTRKIHAQCLTHYRVVGTRRSVILCKCVYFAVKNNYCSNNSKLVDFLMKMWKSFWPTAVPPIYFSAVWKCDAFGSFNLCLKIHRLFQYYMDGWWLYRCTNCICFFFCIFSAFQTAFNNLFVELKKKKWKKDRPTDRHYQTETNALLESKHWTHFMTKYKNLNTQEKEMAINVEIVFQSTALFTLCILNYAVNYVW